MDIHSIGLNVDGRMVLLYKGGKREEFRKCPFPGCKFYHSEDLEFCPVTNGSIVEEEKRREEKARMEGLAEAARTKHKNKYLPEWREKMSMRLVFLGTVALLFFIFSSSSSLKNVSGVIGCVIFILIIPWDIWERRREKRVEKQADAIYESVLKGEEIEA